MLVFCPDFTRQSRLAPQYMVSLDELCKRDYGKSCFPNAIFCLDLDAYESSKTGNNDATMDAAVGIANYIDNRESSSRHFLVELRLDYKSTNHFDYNNMAQKVSHSKSILLPEPLEPYVCFIYSTQLTPKAQNDFSRRARQQKDVFFWKAMSPSDFLNYVFDKSALPYQPLNDLDAIRKSLELKYDEGGIDSADCLVKFWMEQMDKYVQRYMHAENKAIASVLLSFLESLSCPDNTIEKDFVELRIEDVKRYIM